jgi:hypothetical protein
LEPVVAGSSPAPGAIALLRERLGDDSFAAAFARGEGLAPGDVIAAIVT